MLNKPNEPKECVKPQNLIKSLRLSKKKNIIVSYLNINSIRNKFDSIQEMVAQNVDVLCLAETKLDSSFPESQFLLENFKKPYRLDISSFSGGLLLYVKSSIPSRTLSTLSLPNDIQIILAELNFRKQKWLYMGIYRPPSQSLSYFINNIVLLLDHYSATYSNVLIMGDFNATPNDPVICKIFS